MPPKAGRKSLWGMIPIGKKDNSAKKLRRASAIAMLLSGPADKDSPATPATSPPSSVDSGPAADRAGAANYLNEEPREQQAMLLKAAKERVVQLTLGREHSVERETNAQASRDDPPSPLLLLPAGRSPPATPTPTTHGGHQAAMSVRSSLTGTPPVHGHGHGHGHAASGYAPTPSLPPMSGVGPITPLPSTPGCESPLAVSTVERERRERLEESKLAERVARRHAVSVASHCARHRSTKKSGHSGKGKWRRAAARSLARAQEEPKGPLRSWHFAAATASSASPRRRPEPPASSTAAWRRLSVSPRRRQRPAPSAAPSSAPLRETAASERLARSEKMLVEVEEVLALSDAFIRGHTEIRRQRRSSASVASSDAGSPGGPPSVSSGVLQMAAPPSIDGSAAESPTGRRALDGGDAAAATERAAAPAYITVDVAVRGRDDLAPLRMFVSTSMRVSKLCALLRRDERVLDVSPTDPPRFALTYEGAVLRPRDPLARTPLFDGDGQDGIAPAAVELVFKGDAAASAPEHTPERVCAVLMLCAYLIWRRQFDDGKALPEPPPVAGAAEVEVAPPPPAERGRAQAQTQRARTKKKRPAASERAVVASDPALEAELLLVRQKLRAASYTAGGMDPERLFERMDRDRSGALDADELLSAVRRVLKVPPGVVSDAEVDRVFAALDVDGDGEVSVSEFVGFVGSPDAGSSVRARVSDIEAAVRATRPNAAKVLDGVGIPVPPPGPPPGVAEQ